MHSDEAPAFQQSWNSYLIITTPNSWMKILYFRCTSEFSRRLIQQATHCLVEWLTFEKVHHMQYHYFRNTNEYMDEFATSTFRSALWMECMMYRLQVGLITVYYFPISRTSFG